MTVSWTLFIWIGLIAYLVWWGQTFYTRELDFIGNRKKFFTASAVVLAICIFALFTKGLNYGLDFTGGTILELGAYQRTDTDTVRKGLETLDFPLGDIQVQTGADMIDPGEVDQEGGATKPYQKLIIRLTTESGEQLNTDQTGLVLEGLSSTIGDYVTLRTASIGPTISDELRSSSLTALGIVLLLQLLYIFVRFGNQIRYGLAADIALVHDVIIMLGFYSLSQREVDAAFIAALLTIVGYSVMDSVVIFDRIRENVAMSNKTPYSQIVNTSINQTMTRSINTTLTTVVSLLSIYYFGGSTLQDFAFALLVGIISGAYSSICIAAPVVVEIDQRDQETASESSSKSQKKTLKPVSKKDSQQESKPQDSSQESDNEATSNEQKSSTATKKKRKPRANKKKK